MNLQTSLFNYEENLFIFLLLPEFDSLLDHKTLQVPLLFSSGRVMSFNQDCWTVANTTLFFVFILNFFIEV